MHKRTAVFILCLLWVSAAFSETIDTSPRPKEFTTDTYINITPTNAAYEITFKTPLDVAMAVFNANNCWYVVFDKKISFEWPSSAVKDLFIVSLKEISQGPLQTDITVLEIKLKPQMSFRVQKNDKTWSLQLYYFDHETPVSAPLTEGSRMHTGSECTWPAFKIENVHPQARETFIRIEGQKYYVLMAPAIDGGGPRALPPENDFYDFPPTVQGVACRLMNETVFFDKSVAGRLVISPVLPTAIPLPLPQPVASYSYFSSPVYLTDQTVDSLDHMCQRAFKELSENRPIEAEITLVELEKKFPSATFAPLIKAYRGMAFFLKNDYQKALDALDTLTESDEVYLLKFFAHACLDHMQLYDDTLKRIPVMIKNYPAAMRNAVGEVALSILAAYGDYETLGMLVSVLTSEENSSYMKNILAYYKALRDLKTGGDELALADLERLAVVSSRNPLPLTLQYEAQFIVIDEKMKHGKLKTDDAIPLLSDARFRLRASSLEYRILKRLISLYESQKKLPEILEALAYLRTNYTERSLVDRLDLKFEQTLIEYFKQDLSKLSPLKVITLYEQYRDLIPTNDEGERIIRRVADEFVAIDLLEDAAHLLTKWAIQQEDPKQKGRILVDVANIFLTDSKSQEALTVLELLPLETDLKDQERALTIRAKCLGKLGRSIEALNLLKDSQAPLHRQLMADIYMQHKRWRDAAATLSALNDLLGDDQRGWKEKVLSQLAIARDLDSQQQIVSPKDQEVIGDAYIKSLIDETTETSKTREGVGTVLKETDGFLRGAQQRLETSAKG